MEKIQSSQSKLESKVFTILGTKNPNVTPVYNWEKDKLSDYYFFLRRMLRSPSVAGLFLSICYTTGFSKAIMVRWSTYSAIAHYVIVN